MHIQSKSSSIPTTESNFNHTCYIRVINKRDTINIEWKKRVIQSHVLCYKKLTFQL
jgi:hypothetical protein